ncbi:AAA family ATPase [Flavihumibacter sp. R14]|nr:AAA family ATPase [Flavihumibacter soli]
MNKKIIDKAGTIVTFYSYKGGVGRSFALANVSVVLAQWGYKTLIIDWDLEAPGLENFFKDYISIDSARAKPGLIDILTSATDSTTKKVSWRDCLLPIKYDDFKSNLNIESLNLITSGNFDENYYDKVRAFDFNNFYTNSNGGQIIEDLRNDWKKEFDFIFIDSRTGVTDIGGVCTIQLPDILALLFTPTDQGFEGVRRVAAKAAKAQMKLPFDRINLLTLPIPTRIDNSETEKINEWMEKFEKGLAEIYDVWLPKDVNRKTFLLFTKIPYTPFYSFGERLPVIDEGLIDPARMGYAYEAIAALIAVQLNQAKYLVDNRTTLVNLAKNSSSVMHYSGENEDIDHTTITGSMKYKDDLLETQVKRLNSLESKYEAKNQEIAKKERKIKLLTYGMAAILPLVAFIFYLRINQQSDNVVLKNLSDSSKSNLNTDSTLAEQIDSVTSESAEIDSSQLSPRLKEIFNQGKPVGIDISRLNKIESWLKVKGSGVDFILMKATDGNGRVDISFVNNWPNARKFNFVRGAYHYFSVKTDPSKQADLFIKTVKLQPGDLPPILNLDALSHSANIQSSSFIQMLRNVKIILDLFEEEYRVKPIIYARYNLVKALANESEYGTYPLWIGVYGKNRIKSPILPAGVKNWSFWQFSTTEVVNGISTSNGQRVDVNQFNGTLEELDKFTMKKPIDWN